MKAILSTPGFWYLGLSLGLLFSAYSAVLSNLTPYAINLGGSKEQASTLIMSVAIAGFCGKILFGMAADKIQSQGRALGCSGTRSQRILVLATEPEYLWMLVGSALLGLAAGGMLPVWGALMAKVFGACQLWPRNGFNGPDNNALRHARLRP